MDKQIIFKVPGGDTVVMVKKHVGTTSNGL